MNPALPKKNYGDTNFITGMRAFAALAVVLIHSGGAGFRELGNIGNNIADFGRAGVYVFFVISGFSVASSYANSSCYFDYLNKRLWRVAPLYYFWLATSILLGTTATSWQEQFSVDIDSYNLLLHGLFVGWLDYRITNSILGVEWSIPIEVFWYFFVPIMLVVFKNNAKTLGALAAALLTYIISVKFPNILPVKEENAAIAMHWSPIPYVLSYALGVTAYRFRKHCKHTNGIGNLVLVLSISMIGIYVLRPGIIINIFYDEFVFTSLLTTALILFGTNKSRFFKLMFGNSVTQFIGVVSYGIYLCHLPLLSLISRYDILTFDILFVRFFLVAISAILVSAFTYYVFELRCTLIGRKFGERVQAATKAVI